MREDLYSIHGIGLRFITNSSAIATAAQTLLRHFQQETLESPIALEFLFKGVDSRAEIPVVVSPAAQVLFSGRGQAIGDLLRSEWQCHVYRDQDCTIADFHEQGLLFIDHPRGRVEGYLSEPEAMHLDVRIIFFHFALTELLKGKGLYTIHATALAKGGRGLLIPGASGRGKTTSLLALLRAGYCCLSDDHPLLRTDGTGLEILSFPVKIDVTEQTIEFFPELKEVRESLHQGVSKRYFYPEDIYPQGQTDSDFCRPVLILFPQIVDAPKSSLELLPKRRALELLLPESLLVYNKEAAGRQFQALARLVEQTACYRLYFGADILDLPQLIDPLLAEA